MLLLKVNSGVLLRFLYGSQNFLVLLYLDVDYELVIPKADGACLHLLCLEQVAGPGVVHTALGSLAAVDTVGLDELCTLPDELLGDFFKRIDVLGHSEVYMCRREIVGCVEPDVLLLGVLYQRVVFVLVSTHEDGDGWIGL